MQPKIGGAMVTRNRAAALDLTLRRTLGQTRPLDRLVLVDNASTDTTGEIVQQQAAAGGTILDYDRRSENLGCSAGFAAALEQLLRSDCDWFWLLDDDATPAPDALEQLAAQISSSLHVYCSAGIGPEGPDPALCWPVAFRQDQAWSGPAHLLRDLPDAGEVEFSSFLGMLVHRSLVEAVGLPDIGFFISGDDVEYSYRLRRHGAQMLLIKSSLVRHPLPRRRCVKLLGVEIQVLDNPAWKRYYEIRNRLVIAKRYHGRRLWSEALPGTLLRWMVTLVVQPSRLAQSAAFARGIFDALTGRMGMRWVPP